MKIIIDRFEDDFAVVEMPDKTIQNLPLVFVPGTKEGDIIHIEIDNTSAKERKEYIEQKANKLWGR